MHTRAATPSFTRTRESLVRRMAAVVALAAVTAAAHATLPPPTPQEAAAQAAKKVAADAQAAKDKQELYATMDSVAAHWRGRAAKEHWTVHPAIAVPPPPAPPPAASDSKPAAKPAAEGKRP
jgi:colicin import membrane protein